MAHFLEALSSTFALNVRAAGLNLEGVGEEEALREPDSGGNSLNWIAGHIVSYRNRILELVGEPPVWDGETARRYDGTDDAGWSPAAALPIERIRADLERSQELLEAALSRLGPDDLERPAGERTTGALLSFLQFHETYHVGQLGLARRLVGLPGVIKPQGRRPPAP